MPQHDDRYPEDRKIVAAAHKQAVQALTPEQRQERQRRNELARDKANERRRQFGIRQIAILERLLSGHSRADAARALGMSERHLNKTIFPVWPFPASTREQRYVAVRVSPADVDALDRLSADLALTRTRALEDLVRAMLESDALPARRTLKVQRREPAP